MHTDVGSLLMFQIASSRTLSNIEKKEKIFSTMCAHVEKKINNVTTKLKRKKSLYLFI